MDGWPVVLIIAAIVVVASVAYLAGSRQGREVLEERRLDQALRTRVRDVMTSPVVSVGEDTAIEAAARMMHERRIGALPVVGSDGRLIGLLTESDLTGVGGSLRRSGTLGGTVRASGAEEAYEQARSLPVTHEMTRKVITATEDEPVTDVVAKMIGNDLRHVPVVRDGVPVGMLARHDVLTLITSDDRERS